MWAKWQASMPCHVQCHSSGGGHPLLLVLSSLCQFGPWFYDDVLLTEWTRSYPNLTPTHSLAKWKMLVACHSNATREVIYLIHMTLCFVPGNWWDERGHSKVNEIKVCIWNDKTAYLSSIYFNFIQIELLLKYSPSHIFCHFLNENV